MVLTPHFPRAPLFISTALESRLPPPFPLSQQPHKLINRVQSHHIDQDFLSTESQKAPKSTAMERKNSFRGIQGAISKINPELLRSVITSGTVARGGPQARSPPGATTFRHATVPLPVLTSASRTGSKGTAPLTIFYNGTVAVFDLPQDKAESILKLAVKENVGGVLEASDPTASGHEEDHLLAKLNGELLPIARKKSLERFFAKRKERLAVSRPYEMAEREVNMALAKETETITAA